MTLETLGLDQLNRNEKLELVAQLLDSIPESEPSGSTLTLAQREELQRRISDSKMHPDQLVPWEEVYAKSLERLKS